MSYIWLPENRNLIFNSTTSQFIEKTKDGVLITPLSDDEPLHLEGEAAESYWNAAYQWSQVERLYSPVSRRVGSQLKIQSKMPWISQNRSASK